MVETAGEVGPRKRYRSPGRKSLEGGKPMNVAAWKTAAEQTTEKPVRGESNPETGT
jgi:hypothetical protein